VKKSKEYDQDEEYREGKRHLDGTDGARVDHEKAFVHLCRAANQGHPDAQNEVGFMYDNGMGVEEDKVEAERWFRKSALQGSPTAQFNLGDAYFYGYGMEKNLQEAIVWYRQSADQGFPPAKDKILEIIASGNFLKEMSEKNTVTAEAMIEAAVAEGWVQKGDIGFIPELATTQRRATDNSLGIAIQAMDAAMEQGDPTQGVQAMRMICGYLFAKSVESVMLWADSPDGRINVEYDLGDAFHGEYTSSLRDDRSKTVMDTMKNGALLFGAHYEVLTDRLMGTDDLDETYVQAEMREALEWTQRLAVAYAIQKGYQATGGR